MFKPFNPMKLSEIALGGSYMLDGEVAHVTGFEGGKVIVETPSNGEEAVAASKLKPLEPLPNPEFD